MCIIIDADRMDRFFAAPLLEEVEPIHKWIGEKDGIIAYSIYGKLRDELTGIKKAKFQEMYRNGRAILIDSEKIRLEQQRLAGIGNCKSNDVHILALANVSGARVLYTGDDALMDDFRNREIINNPRGKIYSSARNKNLLRANLCKRTT